MKIKTTGYRFDSSSSSDKPSRIITVDIVLDILEVLLKPRFLGYDVGFKLGPEILCSLLPLDGLYEHHNIHPHNGDVFVDLLSILLADLVCQTDHGIEDLFDLFAIRRTGHLPT